MICTRKYQKRSITIHDQILKVLTNSSKNCPNICRCRLPLKFIRTTFTSSICSGRLGMSIYWPGSDLVSNLDWFPQIPTFIRKVTWLTTFTFACRVWASFWCPNPRIDSTASSHPSFTQCKRRDTKEFCRALAWKTSLSTTRLCCTMKCEKVWIKIRKITTRSSFFATTG